MEKIIVPDWVSGYLDTMFKQDHPKTISYLRQILKLPKREVYCKTRLFLKKGAPIIGSNPPMVEGSVTLDGDEIWSGMVRDRLPKKK